MAPRDPVCRMVVEGDNPRWTSVHREAVYLFCSAGCKRLFDVNPERYLRVGPVPG